LMNCPSLLKSLSLCAIELHRCLKVVLR